MNNCNLTKYLGKTLKDDNYELNEKSDKWKQGCRNYKLIINLLIKNIQESKHYNTLIKQNYTDTNIYTAIEKINTNLRKLYEELNKTDINLILILQLSEKYETKDEIRKIKNQLEENIKCLVAIRYHKKYDKLVDDIVDDIILNLR